MSLILVGILISSTIGLSINEHYCSNYGAITSIGLQQAIPCSCELPMQDDCCQDVSTFYSFSGFFNLAPSTINSQPVFQVVEPTYFKIVAIANQLLSYNVVKDMQYPLAEPKVYLKIQSFLL